MWRGSHRAADLPRAPARGQRRVPTGADPGDMTVATKASSELQEDTRFPLPMGCRADIAQHLRCQPCSSAAKGTATFSSSLTREKMKKDGQMLLTSSGK